MSGTDPLRDELLDSADDWDEQAHRLMLQRLGDRPTLRQVSYDLGNETWLAAFALLDLSPALTRDAAQYTCWSRHSGYFHPAEDGDDLNVFEPEAEMDWHAWIISVDNTGRGWSSTEYRLFQIIAGIIGDRPLLLRGVLDALGSWQHDVLAILTRWANGGTNFTPASH